MKSIQEYYGLLDERWVCTPSEYPILASLSQPTDILAFNLHHTFSHVHKSIGRVEALLEKVDHGTPIESMKTEEMSQLIGKSLVNILHIAKLLNLAPEQIEGWIDGYFAKAAK